LTTEHRQIVHKIFWGHGGKDRGAAPAPTFLLILVDETTIMPDAWEGMRSSDEISDTKKGPNPLCQRVRKHEKV